MTKSGAPLDVADYLKLVAVARRAPNGHFWATYDAEADTLYVNFKRPSHATDSELTDDDVIVRYEGDDGRRTDHPPRQHPLTAQARTK